QKISTRRLPRPHARPPFAAPGNLRFSKRWIVWKLAATERRFPSELPAGYLSAGRVLQQLQYR
ncbi:unnamed protein product, partial [Hapterophycus canaliculatus]